MWGYRMSQVVQKYWTKCNILFLQNETRRKLELWVTSLNDTPRLQFSRSCAYKVHLCWFHQKWKGWQFYISISIWWKNSVYYKQLIYLTTKQQWPLATHHIYHNNKTLTRLWLNINKTMTNLIFISCHSCCQNGRLFLRFGSLSPIVTK